MVSTGLVLGVTAVTVVVFTAIGLLAARGRVSSVESFISARDSAGHGTVTATVVASMMGAWILFAPAEAGAAFGGLPAILGYAVGSAVPLLLFIPVGARIRSVMPSGHSLTESAYARFGATMYLFVLVVSVFYLDAARESRPSREGRVFRHLSEPRSEQGGSESRKLWKTTDTFLLTGYSTPSHNH